MDGNDLEKKKLSTLIKNDLNSLERGIDYMVEATD